MELSHSKKTQFAVFNQADLSKQLRTIGVVEGDVLEVHASIKSIGLVLGGASTLLDALLEVLGFDGTLVMSAQSWGNSEPAYFENPPIDIELFHKVRFTHPPFRGKTEDFHSMGSLVQALQMRPNVYVSSHPQAAFIATGKHAKWITQVHPLNDAFGNGSPLGRMRELKAKVLLIGVDYDRCTGMHLGETLSEARPILIQGSRIQIGAEAKWIKFLSLAYDSDDFILVGKQMEQEQSVSINLLGGAITKFFPLETAVLKTQNYFEAMK